MENPLISICIPTYNGEKFLQDALDSVSSQTYRNFEVIISDDASRDQTWAICEQFKEKSAFPVIIYRHKPQGIGANWDHCIEKANGKWIKFLFQDDILEENCLEEFLKVQKHTRKEVIYCKRIIIDEMGSDISEGSIIADLQAPIHLAFDDLYLFSKKDLKKLASQNSSVLSHNFFGEPVACFASKKTYSITGNHNTNLKQLLDLEYSMRLLENYDIVFTAKKLIRFRVHNQQTSHCNKLTDVKENNILNAYVIKKYFRYLDKRVIMKYYYNKYPLLGRLRGKIQF